MTNADMAVMHGRMPPHPLTLTLLEEGGGGLKYNSRVQVSLCGHCGRREGRGKVGIVGTV